MTLDEINSLERKENESFLSWITSPSFQLQSHAQRTNDLELYMASKNAEIAMLQVESTALKARIKQLENGISEVSSIIKG